VKEINGDIEFDLLQLNNGNVIGVEYVNGDFYMMFGKTDGLKRRITQLCLTIEATIMLQHLISKRLSENNIVITVSDTAKDETIIVSKVDIQKYEDA